MAKYPGTVTLARDDDDAKWRLLDTEGLDLGDLFNIVESVTAHANDPHADARKTAQSAEFTWRVACAEPDALIRDLDGDAIYRVTRTLVYEGTFAWLDKTLSRGGVPMNGAWTNPRNMRITSTLGEIKLVSERDRAVETLERQAAALGFKLVGTEG